MTQCKQVKQQEWHPKYSIQSLFYMQVTMELHRANDWGGRQHDSPTTPLHTHAHTLTAVASPTLDSTGHSCGNVQWGQKGGNYAKRGKENKGAKKNEKRGK